MQYTLPLLTSDFSYELVRSAKRRTLAIEIHPGGRVKVRAPLRTSERAIAAFVAEKRDWIDKKRAELSTAAPNLPRRFLPGERLSYLGQEYRLDVQAGRRQVTLDGDRIVVNAKDFEAARIQAALVAWFKTECERLLPERVGVFAPLVGAAPVALRYRHNRRRWGSCDFGAKTIFFNVTLAMAPQDLIDYVVVHELCHLLVPDHSPRYWREVARVMPDYEVRRRALQAREAVYTLY